MKKKLFHRILLGFGIGILIGIGFYVLAKVMNDSVKMTDPLRIIRNLIFCGLYGSACFGGMLLYKIDNFSRLSATLIHLLIVMGGLFLLGLSLGWKFDSRQVCLLFAAYIFMFFLIWIIIYLVGKRRVRKMNRNLQQWKSARTGFRTRPGSAGNDQMDQQLLMADTKEKE